MTSPTVTADRELLDLTMVRLIAAIGVGRVSVDLAKDAVSRLSELDMELGAARLRIDELLRARSALADVGESAYNWGTPPFPNYPAETVDSMAEIGEAFMDALPNGYSWLQSPSEIIADLQNQLHDAKQPRPAAEERKLTPGERAGVDKAFWASVTEVSPAAHTAQVTEEEREALLAGAYAMNGPICAAYDNGDRALETRRKEYQQTLRRLAEQGSGATGSDK
jgi:hypothetical protein